MWSDYTLAASRAPQSSYIRVSSHCQSDERKIRARYENFRMSESLTSGFMASDIARQN
ncbi:hypothetical protein BDR04DRAFT_1100222 [Suillus decipiens]|nr:hypothetical protein BDR04DRAFT_1100222 [Suillus decipiens]